jgi:hypothetical protein
MFCAAAGEPSQAGMTGSGARFTVSELSDTGTVKNVLAEMASSVLNLSSFGLTNQKGGHKEALMDAGRSED